MSDIKYSNFFATTLSATLASGDLSMTVASATNAPAVAAATDYAYILLIRASDLAKEIVKVTAISGTTFTIERAQEGTTAINFVIGDAVRGYFTAGVLTALVAQLNTSIAAVEAIVTQANDVATQAVALAQAAQASADAITPLQSADLGDGQVLTQHLADAAVTAAKLGTGAVTAAKLAAAAVESAALAAGCVVTAAIANEAVTEAKLAGGAVTPAKSKIINGEALWRIHVWAASCSVSNTTGEFVVAIPAGVTFASPPLVVPVNALGTGGNASGVVANRDDLILSLISQSATQSRFRARQALDNAYAPNGSTLVCTFIAIGKVAA